MASEVFEQSAAAAEYIRSRVNVVPKIAIILGSGLGPFAYHVEQSISIPFTEIPHFPKPSVVGHSGLLVVGKLHGTPLIVMQGRVHYYEGYPASEVVFPIRVLKQMGIEKLIVTNAAGGIREGLQRGQLVLISNHINLTGTNPLIGKNDSKFGERFFDMTEPYSERLRKMAKTVAKKEGFDLEQGVYLAVSGPSFETAAEIRAFRILGADLVGMSTVHEVIVARHMNMEVLGLSCVTNLAAGIQGKPLDHYEVLETGIHVQQRFAEFMTSLVGQAAAVR
jgi:purine-nucleoside phosphorylase